MKELLHNLPLVAAFLGWLLAQLLKPFSAFARTKKWDWSVLRESGGMPSSHSAAVGGLTAGIALTEGFGSPLFALSMVLAAVVMYDACHVRREAGEHGRVLNYMMEHWGKPTLMDVEYTFQEILGHTNLQVVLGCVLGVAVAVVMAHC